MLTDLRQIILKVTALGTSSIWVPYYTPRRRWLRPLPGEVKFQGHLLYVGQAFAGLDVAFRATAQEDQWALFFGWKRIGQVDLKDLSKTVLPK